MSQPLPDHKYLVQLTNHDGRRAVVVDWTPEEAKQRAMLHDYEGGWDKSKCRIICRVRASMTNQAMAIETVK